MACFFWVSLDQPLPSDTKPPRFTESDPRDGARPTDAVHFTMSNCKRCRQRTCLQMFGSNQIYVFVDLFGNFVTRGLRRLPNFQKINLSRVLQFYKAFGYDAAGKHVEAGTCAERMWRETWSY